MYTSALLYGFVAVNAVTALAVPVDRVWPIAPRYDEDILQRLEYKHILPREVPHHMPKRSFHVYHAERSPHLAAGLLSRQSNPNTNDTLSTGNSTSNSNGTQFDLLDFLFGDGGGNGTQIVGQIKQLLNVTSNNSTGGLGNSTTGGDFNATGLFDELQRNGTAFFNELGEEGATFLKELKQNGTNFFQELGKNGTTFVDDLQQRFGNSNFTQSANASATDFFSQLGLLFSGNATATGNATASSNSSSTDLISQLFGGKLNGTSIFSGNGTSAGNGTSILTQLGKLFGIGDEAANSTASNGTESGPEGFVEDVEDFFSDLFDGDDDEETISSAVQSSSASASASASAGSSQVSSAATSEKTA